MLPPYNNVGILETFLIHESSGRNLIASNKVATDVSTLPYETQSLTYARPLIDLIRLKLLNLHSTPLSAILSYDVSLIGISTHFYSLPHTQQRIRAQKSKARERRNRGATEDAPSGGQLQSAGDPNYRGSHQQRRPDRDNLSGDDPSPRRTRRTIRRLQDVAHQT